MSPDEADLHAGRGRLPIVIDRDLKPENVTESPGPELRVLGVVAPATEPDDI